MPARQSAAMDRALKLVRKGMGAYAAAKEAGVSYNACRIACLRHGLPLQPVAPKVLDSIPPQE